MRSDWWQSRSKFFLLISLPGNKKRPEEVPHGRLMGSRAFGRETRQRSLDLRLNASLAQRSGFARERAACLSFLPNTRTKLINPSAHRLPVTASPINPLATRAAPIGTRCRPDPGRDPDPHIFSRNGYQVPIADDATAEGHDVGAEL